MKRIAIFCDGTWNGLDAPEPTNVVKLAEAVAGADAEGAPQIVWYGEGVGTGQPVLGRAEKFLGGAFGVGLMANVEAAYRFLVFNHAPGDAIYIFGFSRGAFTARTLAGLIRNAGIVRRSSARRIKDAVRLYRSRDPNDHPDADRACAFRAEHAPDMHVSEHDLAWRRANRPGLAERSTPLTIRHMGLWDTVGALGVPNHLFIAALFNRRYRFHDARISAMVESARHALAIDETRRIFDASPWDRDKLDRLNAEADVEPAPYQQQWFPGDHGSVGGGGDVTGLSDGALLWVKAGAEAAGLRFEPDAISGLAPDACAPLRNISGKKGVDLLGWVSRRPRSGPERLDAVSDPAVTRWRSPPETLPEREVYRPATLKRVAAELDAPPAG
ncbi:DUF2235 domain-containing protein [Marinicauda salina]|nr:DUF2235 domain-containing protein [Marinicauda salina]